MTLSTKSVWAVMALLCVAVLGVGGCGGPGKYDVEVGLDPALKGQTVEVDLIGVNNTATLNNYKSYDVNRYFAAGDALRADTKDKRYTMKFVAGGPDKQTLKVSDPKWDSWNTPTSLVIMASIPGLADKKGENDPRRKVLSLETKNWEGRKLDILVTRSGLDVLTPEKKKE